MATEPLGALLQSLGLPVALLSPLLAHAGAVAHSSARLSLTSERDRAIVPARHTADSLLVARAVPPSPGAHWLDVGSGGGFPGLVLAICYPGALFTLAESNRRKAGFLELMTLDLGVSNAIVWPDRAERLPQASFDVSLGRAFVDPAAAFGLLLSLVKPGGRAIVAASRATPPPSGAVSVDASFDDVDSPGALLMMTRAVDGP